MALWRSGHGAGGRGTNGKRPAEWTEADRGAQDSRSLEKLSTPEATSESRGERQPRCPRSGREHEGTMPGSVAAVWKWREDNWRSRPGALWPQKPVLETRARQQWWGGLCGTSVFLEGPARAPGPARQQWGPVVPTAGGCVPAPTSPRPPPSCRSATHFPRLKFSRFINTRNSFHGSELVTVTECLLNCKTPAPTENVTGKIPGYKPNLRHKVCKRG